MHVIKSKLINEGTNRGNKLLTNCGDKHDNKARKHGDVISDPKRELKKKKIQYQYPSIYLHYIVSCNWEQKCGYLSASECRYRGGI